MPLAAYPLKSAFSGIILKTDMHRAKLPARTLRRSAEIAFLLILALLHGCASMGGSADRLTAQALKIDCFGIALRQEVPVTISLIPSPIEDPQARTIVIIGYEEKANIPGEFVAARSRFLNVYFLALGSIEEDGFIPASAQIVINIWIYDPEDRLKTCHQWRLTDADLDDRVDRVEKEIVTENEWNTMTGIQSEPIADQDLERYSELYRRCVTALLERIGSNLSELFWRFGVSRRTKNH